MRLIHNILLTVLVPQDHDSDLTAKAFLDFLPFDLEEEKLLVQEDTLKHIHGDSLTKFSIKILKERHINKLISDLKEKLGSDQIARLNSEENRIDEESYFYLRVDRKKFEEEQIVALTDGGDCFHFKILLASYPKTRVKALIVAKEVWK